MEKEKVGDISMKSDLEIANETKMLEIKKIAKKLNLSDNEYELYGKYKAKVDFSVFNRPSKNGKVILVPPSHQQVLGKEKRQHVLALLKRYIN